MVVYSHFVNSRKGNLFIFFLLRSISHILLFPEVFWFWNQEYFQMRHLRQSKISHIIFRSLVWNRKLKLFCCCLSVLQGALVALVTSLMFTFSMGIGNFVHKPSPNPAPSPVSTIGCGFNISIKTGVKKAPYVHHLNSFIFCEVTSLNRLPFFLRI